MAPTRQELQELKSRVAAGELPGVVAELREGVGLDTGTKQMLMLWQRQLGDYAGAERTAAELLGADPGDSWTRHNLASVRWLAGSYDAADRDLGALQLEAELANDAGAAAALRGDRENLAFQLEPLGAAREAESRLDSAFIASVTVTALLCAAALWWSLRPPSGGGQRPAAGR